MEGEKLKKIISDWASQLPYTLKIMLFGSRLKGTAKADSDFDIAIEFLDDDIDPVLLWFDVHDEWQDYLSLQIGSKVDLQLYEGDKSPHLKKYLEEASTLLYCSKKH